VEKRRVQFVDGGVVALDFFTRNVCHANVDLIAVAGLDAVGQARAEGPVAREVDADVAVFEQVFQAIADIAVLFGDEFDAFDDVGAHGGDLRFCLLLRRHVDVVHQVELVDDLVDGVLRRIAGRAERLAVVLQLRVAGDRRAVRLLARPVETRPRVVGRRQPSKGRGDGARNRAQPRDTRVASRPHRFRSSHCETNQSDWGHGGANAPRSSHCPGASPGSRKNRKRGPESSGAVSVAFGGGRISGLGSWSGLDPESGLLDETTSQSISSMRPLAFKTP